jgi:hypothetical protein
VLYVEEFQRGLATQLAPAAWALPPIGIGTADPARPTVPPAVTRVPARALEPRAPLLLWYY